MIDPMLNIKLTVTLFGMVIITYMCLCGVSAQKTPAKTFLSLYLTIFSLCSIILVFELIMSPYWRR